MIGVQGLPLDPVEIIEENRGQRCATGLTAGTVKCVLHVSIPQAKVMVRHRNLA